MDDARLDRQIVETGALLTPFDLAPLRARRPLRVSSRSRSAFRVALTDRGQMVFEALRRIRTHRTRDKSGAYRWYSDYRLPTRLGEGTVTVPLHANDEDLTRRFNRTENVGPIPPSDPDFALIYARRNDAESINRNHEDTLFLGRAHSVGRLRQQVDLIRR